jgi:hypothetical protein
VGIAAAACSSSPGGPGVATLQSGSQSTTTTFSSSQIDQTFVDFARCLRRHGVAEPDPFHRPGHSGLSVEVPPETPQNRVALSACNHYLEPVVAMKQAGARTELSRWLPALIRYARCMRAHDISMPDPGPQGQLNLGPVSGMSSQFGRYTPQFRAADAACRSLLPAGVHDDGTGP